MPPTKKTTPAKATKAPAAKKSVAAAVKKPATSSVVAPASSTVRGARRRLSGVVVSDKMTNTVSVRVDRTVLHAKYQKRYVMSKKYLAHNPNNTAKAGQTVTIEETRPLSARKRWRIVSVDSK